jgi:SPX domain protein involved in polyphosphate accumulation
MKNIQKKSRHERKFVFSGNIKLSLFNILTKSNFSFREHYLPRNVNSIYFDTKNLKYIRDNLYGISNRKKVRVRWYGDSERLNNPVLEIKIKSNFESYKKNFSLKKFNGTNIHDFDSMNKLYKYINQNFTFSEFLVPICSVNYKRIYLVSSNNLVRATIDTNIRYKKYMNFQEDFYRHHSKTVLEIKYDTVLDNYVRKNIDFIKSRLSKNSKYINGAMFTSQIGI